MKHQINTLLCVWLLGLTGCFPAKTQGSMDPISESELIGTWELNYDGKVIFERAMNKSVYGKGVETIKLHKSGNYEQFFHDGSGALYSTVKSKWSLSINREGHPIVVFEKMKNYKNGITYALDSTPPETSTLRVYFSTYHPFGGDKKMTLTFEDPDLNLHFTRK